MANLSFPFDSVLKDTKQDRVYFADDFAAYFRQFIGDGIYINPSTGLQVLSSNNMGVMVKEGAAFIHGYFHQQREDQIFAINTADASYMRRDIFVVQLDLVNRTMEVRYKAGVAGANPQEPALIRTTDIWELKIASVQVRAATQSILQSDITDTRLDSNVCGIVHGVVGQVDTATVFNQYMDYWNAQRVANENAWQAQMNSQEQRFLTQRNTIDAWYASVLADIALLKTFDFDNIAELNGSKRNTVFHANGSITETIVIASNNRKVAERYTVFNANGTISVNVKVYAENGTDIIKQSTTITTFNADGSITEVVS